MISGPFWKFQGQTSTTDNRINPHPAPVGVKHIRKMQSLKSPDCRLPLHPDQAQFDGLARFAGFEKTFIRSYPLAYRLFTRLLLDILGNLPEPVRALDIGSGDGLAGKLISTTVGGYYAAIDSSGESLKLLKAWGRKSQKLRVTAFHHRAEWLLEETAGAEIIAALRGKPTLIVCNAAGHQIRKSFEEIGDIFAKLPSLAQSGAYYLIGDYYYPDSLTEVKIQKSMSWIKETTGQNPTDPEGFLSAARMKTILEGLGLDIVRTEETLVNFDIPLLYYAYVCKK